MHCIGALTVQINAIRIIGHMDWIGFGSAFSHHCGLGWIGFRKLDARPTLRRIALGPYNAYNENNAYFDAASNKRSNFDVVQ